MENKKVQKWLSDRGIKLEESFAVSLRNLAKTYQKENGIKNIEDVYSLMGIKKQYIAYWIKNPNIMQSKKNQAQCY